MSYQKAEWEKIDVLKGLLIILVVLGHTTFHNSAFHDIIFWFHMPLFFALSGAVFKGGVDIKPYVIKKFKRFLPTYVAWFILIAALEGSLFKAKSWIRFLWGGRVCGGVYWYITVLFFSMILFAVLERKLKSRKILIIVLFACLCLGTLESNLIPGNLPDEGMEVLLHSVPWNADVTLVAVFYYGMGFVFKNLLIQERMEGLIKKRYMIVLICLIAIIGFSTFTVLRFIGIFNYIFDMKSVSYSNLLFNLLLSGLAAVILLGLAGALIKTRMIRTVFMEIGKSSLVIMYSHQYLRSVIEDCTPGFTGRPIVVTVVAVAIGYGLYKLLRWNSLTKKLFITGID